MTDVLGFDSAASLTRAQLQDFHDKGGRYVEVYEKYSTPELIKLLHTMGFTVGLIFETTARRALGGYAAGEADARAFLAGCVAKFGMVPPSNVAPAWTADFDATGSEVAVVLNYGKGWKDGLAGRLGTRCYANGAVCKAAKEQGIVSYTWEAGGDGMNGSKLFRGQADEDQKVGDPQHIGFMMDADVDIVHKNNIPWGWFFSAEEHSPDPLPPGTQGPPLGEQEPRVLRLGDSGDDVRALQSILPLVTVDGIFGVDTEEAVKRFQLQHYLQADGVVGPLTRKALGWKNP